MFEKLLEVAKAAENTAPVETQLFFDSEGVGCRMRLRPRHGPTLAAEYKCSWAQFVDANCNPLAFHIKAEREHLIAKLEGPDSTNPNREHDVRQAG